MNKIKKVLIIDDDAIFRKLMSDTLKMNKKFKSTFAENGEVGLTIVKKEKPDFILLDLMMPVMDGLEFLKCLREEKDENIKDIPVLIITQVGDVGKVADATRFGIKGYIIKSNTELGDIVKKIEEMIV